MKNKEKFAKEIIEIVCSGDSLALKNGRPVACGETDCGECDLNFFSGECRKCIAEWAETEYEEPKIQPKVKNCKVDDRILVSRDGIGWVNRYFASYNKDKDLVYAWNDGRTSWTAVCDSGWQYAKLPESEVQE